MSKPEIRKLWELFINDDKYNKYFLSDIENWTNQLDKLKNYIDTHNKRPSQGSKDKEIKILAKWLSQQLNNYKKNINNMKDPEIRKLWNYFINDDKYKSFFKQ